MRIRDFVSSTLVGYIRTLQAKYRYPHASIWSGRIAPAARIGHGCAVADDVEIGPDVEVGDYSYVNRGTIIASGTVGKFCSIGYYCQIGMPEHPIDFASTSPQTYGTRNLLGKPCCVSDYLNPPNIGNDVWIGSGAQILQNVRVGDGAVIAAGAVVTRNVEAFAIVAGIPARTIRYRFDESSVQLLTTLRWWDKPIEELRKMADMFGTTDWISGATRAIHGELVEPSQQAETNKAICQ